MKNDFLISCGILRSGWQFVSLESLAGTEYKDFVSQMDVLIGNMKKLLNGRFSPVLQTAILKWEGYERRVAIQLLAQGDSVAATFFLSSLDIVRILREPVQNAFFRYLIVYGITGEKLFMDSYSWSSSVSTDGNFMCFSGADADGAVVNKDAPGCSYPNLRTVTSLMGF
jgi:hypothetical protein